VSWLAFSIAAEIVIAGGRSLELARRISALFLFCQILVQCDFFGRKVVSLSGWLASSVAAGTLLAGIRSPAILTTT